MSLLSNFFNFVFTYPIFNLLMVLYRLCGDFGLSIIVLTVAIFLMLLPLTYRQLKSAKAMLALQPELAEIRRQHANDLRAQHEATRALYKQHGIASSSPYLPLLVQLPIFTGLYFALNIVLNHATLAQLNRIIYPFLPQLTAVPNMNLNWFTIFNPAWHISLALPDPTHLLPILTGLVTFVQMRMSQPNTAAEIKDAMMQVTQIIQFLMPLIMVLVTIFIAWQLAAGLALYRTTSLLLNMIQQYFVTGHGSLLAVPNVSGILANNAIQNNMPVQQVQPPRTSSSTRGRASGKTASGHRRRKPTKKHR
jgi:YidC/Oxa1 family membrane protein insertase